MIARKIYQAQIEFDVNDRSGRTMGACVVVYQILAGFDVRVQSTRNGQPFGARARARTVETLELVHVEIKRRIEDMVKRLNRQIGLAQLGAIALGRDPHTGANRRIAEAEDTDGGKYEVVCDDHGTVVCVDTLRAARSTSTIDFCDECRDAHPEQ